MSSVSISGVSIADDELAEYAVPEYYLHTPDGGTDLAVVQEFMSRRKDAGIAPISNILLPLPRGLAAIGNQMHLI